MEDNSVDSVVCDPPYGLSFMGKKWDYDVPKVEVWKEALRVLKAGGHILVACGTRTQHRMCVNIEDAGFEIRDIVAWVYGSGFPKSLNIGKAVDNLQGNEREVVGKKEGTYADIRRDKTTGEADLHGGQATNKPRIEVLETKGTSEYEGWGTALKPAMELWTLARKPLSEKTVAENVLKHGTGGINIDESRVGTEDKISESTYQDVRGNSYAGGQAVGRKRLEGRKYKQDPQGRFPANLIHDGSDEVVGLFPDSKSSIFPKTNIPIFNTENGWNKNNIEGGTGGGYDDSGSASRFFYCAKASKSERNAGLDGFEEKQTIGGGGITSPKRQDGSVIVSGSEGTAGKYGSAKAKAANNHPTVKPIKLMQYLTRLITPKGGTVLDPYMGSGTTGIACKKEGFEFIGIELDEDYFEIAKVRIEKLEYQHELF